MEENKVFMGIDPGSPEGDYSHDYTIQKDGDTIRIEVDTTSGGSSGRTLTINQNGEVLSDSKVDHPSAGEGAGGGGGFRDPPKKVQVRDSRGQIYEYTREGLVKLGQAFTQPDPKTEEPQTYLFKIEKPRSKKDRQRAKRGLPYQVK